MVAPLHLKCKPPKTELIIFPRKLLCQKNTTYPSHQVLERALRFLNVPPLPVETKHRGLPDLQPARPRSTDRLTGAHPSPGSRPGVQGSPSSLEGVAHTPDKSLLSTPAPAPSLGACSPTACLHFLAKNTNSPRDFVRCAAEETERLSPCRAAPTSCAAHRPPFSYPALRVGGLWVLSQRPSASCPTRHL